MADIIKNKKIPEIISFIRQRDFKFIKILGQGACGETVLLKDDMLDAEFVCKKYLPCDENYRVDLYKRFLDEIKILYRLNHKNIVRIFNCYLYPASYSGYIMMEYIIGESIDEYLKKYPQNTKIIFEQVIEAFRYLEQNKIVHRDIRANNIMVTNDGEVKIIDFGFSKEVETDSSQTKSISLNWWCEVPDEFKAGVYNIGTDIYFIGQLFENIIKDNKIETFPYKSILRKMILKSPDSRYKTFSEIHQIIKEKDFDDMSFTDQEKKIYMPFSKALNGMIKRIPFSTKYETDIDKIIRNMEEIYKSNMLEDYILSNNNIVSCFCHGNYTYYPNKKVLKVEALRKFIDYLKSCSVDKKNIILANLHTRLDSIEHYEDDEMGEIPF